MYEFFTKWFSTWPLWFVNAGIDYGEIGYLRPMLAGALGTSGAMISRGAGFSAKTVAAGVGYFQNFGGWAGGMFGAPAGASGTGMKGAGF